MAFGRKSVFRLYKHASAQGKIGTRRVKRSGPTVRSAPMGSKCEVVGFVSGDE